MGKRVILLSTKGKINYTDFTFQSNDYLMVGRESAGVPDEIHNEVDEIVTIPISKTSRSLNVSTAAAIALSEAKRQLKV
jgi:tRNA (cytidine/uridine-2'-O-)-methyltransferase